MQLHALLGGNVRQDYSPSDKLSLFNYHGPRGMRLVGLLDDCDADSIHAAAVGGGDDGGGGSGGGGDESDGGGGDGVLGWADLVVGTPAVVARVFERDASFFDDLKGTD
jgi:hypothetical protein